MFIRILWLALLVGAPAFAESPDDTLRAEVPPPEAKPRPVLRKIEPEIHLELRARNDLRDRPETRSEQNVHEVSLGAGYRFTEQVATEVELAVERLNDQSTFFVKQAFIDYKPYEDHLRLRVGQQPLPVGLVNERDSWFSSNPPFMAKLLTTDDQAIDLGATAQLTPGNQRWLYLEGGTYSGRLVREADARSASPDKAPTVASLKSDGEYHRLFASYFEHDLAFYDPVRAYGAGFELDGPETWSVRPSLLGEYWQMRELQKLGPDQHARAWIAVAQLKWWKLTLGQRYSESRAEVESAVARMQLPTELSKVYFLDFAVVPEVRLRAERVMETQSEVQKDEWVARALVDWRFD